MSVEYALVVPNPQVKAIYEEVKRKELKAIFISDMYLPKDIVTAMLRKCGYMVGDEDIFLSGELGLTKASGRLFAHVQRELKCEASEFLHVGDNELSDFEKAKQAGWNAWLVRQPAPLHKSSNRFTTSYTCALQKFFIWDSGRYVDRARELGYMEVGPALLWFTLWLVETAKRARVKQLYFVARDGRTLKRAYDVVTRGMQDAPKSRYLAVSRLALGHPLAAAYLEQQGIGDVSEIQGIVDVGWKGTARQRISQLVGQEVLGYYMCLFSRQPSTESWIERSQHPTIFRPCLTEGTGLLERLLSAQHGTVLGYVRRKGKVKPLLRSGAVWSQSLSHLQAGALQFVKEAVGFGGLDVLDQLRDDGHALRRLCRLIAFPTRTEAELLGPMAWSTGLGDPDGSMRALAPRLRLSKQLRNDWRNVPWRPGSLRRSGMGGVILAGYLLSRIVRWKAMG